MADAHNMYDEVVPYEFQEYPKMVYAADGSSCIVQNEAEERALAPAGPPVPAPEPVAEDAPVNVSSVNVKEAEALIDAISDAATLAAVRLDEESGKNRKTVIKALESRHAELSGA